MPAAQPRRRYAPRLPPQERREQILDAALAIISRHGYAAASMEAIAREAQIAKPVVYDAFETRGELLRSLLEREEARAFATLAEVVPSAASSEDPDALLVEVITAFLHAVLANPTAWRLILMPAGETPDVVREHVEAGRETMTAQVRVLTEWGLPRRTGLATVDADLAARGLIAVGEWAARLVLIEPEAYPPERFARFVGDLLGALPRG
jgi:AcrR family transcriptional regulator